MTPNSPFKKPPQIAHILPQMDEGGVERHVLALANIQAAMGYGITVISAGGCLSERLSGVRHVTMPVHLKNPATGIPCALKISRMKFDIIHAHSRVPTWIGLIASRISDMPLIVTCHSRYSLNAGLWPYDKASGAICVSDTIRRHMAGRLPEICDVIWTGMADQMPNRGSGGGVFELLFVGRLTRVKGPDVIIEATKALKTEHNWRLRVAGDGPLGSELRRSVREAGLHDRISFLGRVADVSGLMEESDCVLFPSRDEGMSLAVAQAALKKCRMLISDIPGNREFFASEDGFVESGSPDAWAAAMDKAINTRDVPCVTPIHDMSEKNWAARTEAFYISVLHKNHKN